MVFGQITPQPFPPFRLIVWLALAWAIIGPGMVPRANAVDFMYVSMSNDTIVRYDISLSTSALVEASMSVFVPSGQGLNLPTGLAFDTAGNLYAANRSGNTITRYDATGTRIGTDFVAAGQGLSGPIGLAFDTAGNLYAANLIGNTITKYDSLGVRQGTNFVATDQGLNNPIGFAFDTAGNLYAANFAASTITKYDSSGARVGTDFVDSSKGLSFPRGLAFDTAGNLYAANSNNTITRYNSSGTRIGTDFVAAGQGLNDPYGLAFDTAGNLYAANFSGNTISKYDSAGALQFSWSTGSASPTFLAVVVPEPSTYVLGAIATGLMAVIARRRKAAARG